MTCILLSLITNKTQTVKKRYHLLSFLFIITAMVSTAQKSPAELTLVYDYSVSGTGNSPQGATNTVYIKGSQSRVELSSPGYNKTTIYDSKTGSAVILNEFSGQKLLIRLNPENVQEQNRRYDAIGFSNTSETKMIAGYKCFKATGLSANGSTYLVYFTKDLVPANRDYDPQFKNLDGLPLEYEITSRGITLKYVISKINLNPVPASKFDIPKSGYREMTYEESKKLKGAQ